MATTHRWDDLQAFLAVARAGRLTEAARGMGVEHTTLSRRITRLETALGAKLFDRRPTGYGLSAEGERLLPRAEEIERAALGIWLDRVDPVVGLTGPVRIGAPEAVGTFCLAEHIGELSVRHPGLSIELVATPRVFSLSKREADLAIGLTRPATGRLHARKLGNYELGLYGAPAYVAHHGRPESQADLHRHRFIGYIDELVFSPELDYFKAALPGLQPTIRISNVITQMTAARTGAGLCILPCFMADKHPDLVRLLPKNVRITRTYWLLTHADMAHLQRIKAVTEFITAVVRAARPAFLPSDA
ncbi:MULTISPECIES: LysR family transcriptional regulator [unclassified Methylobacterium]|uniref:LysR family transcriptional regulator n=1 Tax=unclassified Methylobacterium TaxID=2615210 RepID=UPI0011C1FA14|nr:MULTISPECIES: LysR family transcriptional regulator [unclassified Methylobacterium]QEE41656.1 LysR family transcriptional regulator [Methylobacterium sp. WL1]TXN54973.1 LysR family transcriptional regulator [Methylobacterium sp. WL2]